MRLDEGSFTEPGQLARPRAPEFGIAASRPYRPPKKDGNIPL